MPLSWRATALVLSSFIAPTIVIDFSSAQHAEISRASLPTLHCNVHLRQRCRMNGLIGDLWDEAIEMATYGPGERKILAERRKRAAAVKEAEDDTQNAGKEMPFAFAEARKRFDADDDGGSNDNTSSEDDLTPAAFRQAAAAVALRNGNNNEPSPLNDFDGYALQSSTGPTGRQMGSTT